MNNKMTFSITWPYVDYKYGNEGLFFTYLYMNMAKKI